MSYKDIPARPTLYKGIRMRSRLEADFAAFLDRHGDQWEYEPQCFGSDSGQWLPDFSITETTGSPVYVEVKPYGLIAEWRSEGELYARVNSLMQKMLVARESVPECHLWLAFWEYGGEVMVLLMNHYSDPSWMVSGDFITAWPSPEMQAVLEPGTAERDTEH